VLDADRLPGDLFRAVARHVPPVPGVQSPPLLGHRSAHPHAVPGRGEVEHTPRFFNFRYESAEHFVDIFRRFYGPTHKAFAGARRRRAAALEADLLALLRRAIPAARGAWSPGRVSGDGDHGKAGRR
jgi:hypothetical protein